MGRRSTELRQSPDQLEMIQRLMMDSAGTDASVESVHQHLSDPRRGTQLELAYGVRQRATRAKRLPIETLHKPIVLPSIDSSGTTLALSTRPPSATASTASRHTIFKQWSESPFTGPNEELVDAADDETRCAQQYVGKSQSRMVIL